ncbi:MAG: N-acetyltransferase [Haliangiales bacterium]
MEIRDESSPADIAQITDVTDAAFGQPQEGQLINALRAAGAVTLSLVAVEGDRIVGHVLFSPVVVRDGERRFDAIGLAPIAVAPDRQRAGVGSQLVRAGLERLRAAGHEAVFVLGHPAYYPRFGFRPAAEFGLRWEHSPPTDAFMALELRPESLAGWRGVVSFRPEFDAV